MIEATCGSSVGTAVPVLRPNLDAEAAFDDGCLPFAVRSQRMRYMRLHASPVSSFDAVGTQVVPGGNGLHGRFSDGERNGNSDNDNAATERDVRARSCAEGRGASSRCGGRESRYAAQKPLRMPSAARSDHGFYVDLEKTDDGNLRIALTENGRAEFGTIVEERDKFGIHAALCTLLEDHLCTGWEMVPPEDIGALTAAPILSDDIVRDEEGRVVEAGACIGIPTTRSETRLRNSAGIWCSCSRGWNRESFPGKLPDYAPEIQEVNVKTRGIDSPVAGVIGGIDTS